MTKDKKIAQLRVKLREKQTKMAVAWSKYKATKSRDALGVYNLMSVDIRKIRLQIENVQSGNLSGMGKPNSAITTYTR